MLFRVLPDFFNDNYTMQIKRIFDIPPYSLERYNKQVAFAGKKGGKWVTYSTEEYINYSNLVSYGLMALGLAKGDKIATFSNNRPEWNFVDIGLLQIGAVHVPIYPTINEEELAYVLNEAEVKVAFVSSKYLLGKINSIKENLKFLEYVYAFDEVADAPNFQELLQLGQSNLDEKALDLRRNAVDPSDLASIIYTSGTTSAPKGVMLSHENHVSNVMVAAFTIRLHHSYQILSYLPLSHSYERMVNYIAQYLGISVYYSESVNNILANFKEIKPHVLVTVPLLLEKVYEGILKKGMALKGIKRLIFNWALALAKRYELHREFGWWYMWQLNLANKLVFSKWREALGGNMIKIICGGASVQVHLLHIFWAARIPVYEGYGLTEAAPLVSYNTEDGIKAGTIGRVIHDVIVKISGDGEILVKGPNVMPGYYKHPEWTAEAIDEEGWLHTGDLGTIDNEEFLKITGRKKDIFKINSGIYVYPEVLESKLKQSFFITQALVTGENRNFLTALIQPNFEYLRDWCKLHNIHAQTNQQMVENEKVIKLFDTEVKKINGLGIKENETIQKFAVLPDEWLIDTGELTPSLKMKRKMLTAKYADIINGFYS